jgi:glutathione S-transferase
MNNSQDLTFYYAPRSRAGTVLWMLEETGVPYRLELLRLKKGEQKTPEYLAINPMGKVPAIRHRGIVVTEVSAICAYLADAFPQADLAPAPGDPNRGPYFRWLFFPPSCIEPAMTDKAFKRPPILPSTVGYGDFDSVMDAVSSAVSNTEYVAGERFTAADLVLGSTLDFGMMFGVIPKRNEFTAYVERLSKRDAYKKSHERGNELAAQVDAEDKDS